jgi:hypothetical protein
LKNLEDKEYLKIKDESKFEKYEHDLRCLIMNKNTTD